MLLEGGCFRLSDQRHYRPAPLTPRASYCRHFESEWRWVVLIALGAVVAVGVAVLLRRWRFGPWVAVAVTVLLGLAVAVPAMSLTYFYPAP